MTTSRIPVFITALKTLLDARSPGLDGVEIFTAHPGDSLPQEAIVVTRVTSDQEWGPQGRKARDERFTAFLVLHIQKDGADETTAAETRTRIYALKAEVEEALRGDPKVGDSVLVAEYKRDELRQGAGDRIRWAQLEAQIDVMARI